MTKYAERITTFSIESCRVHVLPTPIKDVVSFRASFETCPHLANDEDLVEEAVTALLDKGTKHHTKDEIAELLDDLGAQLGFYSDGLRVGFVGRCLAKDAGTVFSLVAEQLREPALDPHELELVRMRLIASAKRSLESTADQAAGALRRRVFPADHPNYSIEPEKAIEAYRRISADEVRHYHEHHFGARNCEFVVVGDVTAADIEKSVRPSFESWADHTSVEAFTETALQLEPDRIFVPMPDKPNADVAFGHGLGIRRDDPRYVPLFVGNYILGGNFSARLMSTVRDQMGLTYGIRSGLSGVDRRHEGLWEIDVTLSLDNLERGVDATADVVEAFVDGGVTADELDEKKTTITGSYRVGLATTAGLARALLHNIEKGFDASYLDRFPEEVEAVTLEDVNDAIREFLTPSSLQTVVCGSRALAVSEPK